MKSRLRSWLFVPGADARAHDAAAKSGADVIILELEDFTPPELRARARAMSRDALNQWRAPRCESIRSRPAGART